jgi:hypothetical protein
MPGQVGLRGPTRWGDHATQEDVSTGWRLRGAGRTEGAGRFVVARCGSHVLEKCAKVSAR